MDGRKTDEGAGGLFGRQRGEADGAQPQLNTRRGVLDESEPSIFPICSGTRAESSDTVTL